MPRRKTYLKPSVQRTLDFLLESQYRTLQELKEYQWEKLNKLLIHAYLNVPYYKNLFDRYGIQPKTIQDINDFSRLPVLSKNDIRNNFDQLVSTDCERKELYLNSTGGSTGVPVKIYQDKNYLEWAMAARIRSWKYFPGFDEHEVEAVLWGAIQDIGNSINIKDIFKFILRPKIKVNTFTLDEKKIRRFLALYNFIKPKLIRGYASSLYFLAEWIEKKGIKIHSPKSIVSTAETLFPKMREKISSIFAAKVYDSYGCREVSQIAMQCGSDEGFHMVMENQIVELWENENGLNKILITNLNNYCMPIIRYEVGDLADVIIDDKCTCGRTLPRIKRILGRTNENIILSNGKIINGEYFEFLFYENTSIERYQVQYSRSEERMTIRLKSNTKDDEIIKFIKDTLYRHFEFNNVEIYYTEEFEKTTTGKFKFVWMTD